MHTFLKSMIIYCELFLLTIHFCVIVSVTPNYYGTRNQNRVPAIERNNFLSDPFYVRNNHQTDTEKDPQTKPNQFALVFGPQYFDLSKFLEVLKNQSLIASLTPEYLLSSDLKSPPDC